MRGSLPWIYKILHQEVFKISVSVQSCPGYIYEDVKEKISQSFANLGGIEKYIKKGETVLLKVNLVMRKRPEEAATTNPVFTAALAKVLVDYGCNVIIGDSPGGPFNEARLSSLYKTTGMTQAAQLSGAKLNFSTKSIVINNPSGRVMKKLTIAEFAANAGKIISVSKLKSHGMLKMTGAVKNMFGIIPGTVKAEYHFNYPDVETFSESIVDICQYANPVLSFMDAIEAMEGAGPTAGTPIKVGAILAGNNPFELDLAASVILNTPPEEFPLIKCAIKRELCGKSANEITFFGDDISNFVQKNFKLPNIKSIHFLGKNPPKLIEKFLVKNLQPKPVFNSSLCVGCKDCSANCPAKVIRIENRFPKVDLENCIRCFCCQELCPMKAVEIKRPLLFKVLSKL